MAHLHRLLRNRPSLRTGREALSETEKIKKFGAFTVSESATRILEAATEPEIVLKAWAERITFSSWYGVSADTMQLKANALTKLIEHERLEIAVAAKSVSAKLDQQIEQEKKREQQDDENREQRFE